MSLKIYIGEPGSNNTAKMFQDVIERSILEPNRNFVVIVPEQFTMQTQLTLVNMHPRRGILNIDVLSFERLAYRIFSESGLHTGTRLDETGKNLILKKISLDEKEHLKYFSGKLTSAGSIQELKSIISEFMQYNISSEDLDEFSKFSGSVLSAKISDLKHIMDAYKDFCRNTYLTVEEVPLLLAGLVSDSKYLKDSVVAITGFTGFTPVQLPVISKLLAHSSDVLISMTLDPILDPMANYNERNLFAMSYKMAHDLSKLCEETSTKILPPYKALPDGNAEEKPLEFLERNIFRHRKAVYNAPQSDIRISSHENPFLEMEYISREINRLIRTEGFRYKDFAVITGDLETYGSIASACFEESGIPYFVDRKKAAVHNPYIKMLRAVLSVIKTSWKREGIFNFLRCGLTDFTDDEIDRLENVVIANGINGKKNWHEKWIYTENDNSVEINSIREKVTNLLDPVAEIFHEKKSSVLSKTKALYELSVKLNIQNKLAFRENTFMEAGKISLAHEYSQIYKVVMDVFDKLVEVLGDNSINSGDYCDILEAALTEKKIGLIPPGTDRVFVGDIERSRIEGVRIMFFAGVNEGCVPKSPSTKGFLSETDRQSLFDGGIILSPLPRQMIYQQRFYQYLNLCRPSDKLYISYPETDINQNQLSPAFLIGTVVRLFPNLTVEKPGSILLDDIEKPSDGRKLLPRAILNNVNTDCSDFSTYIELFNWYRRNPGYDTFSRMILEASDNHADDAIGREAAEAIYGKNIHGSATKLESYANCPFSYFMKYGLRLIERREFKFSSLDRGNILHTALDLYAKEIHNTHRKWEDLSTDERIELSDKCIGIAITDYNRDVLHTDARSEYDIYRLKKLMYRTVWATTLQLKLSDFTPAGFEVQVKNDLASMHKDLDSGRTVDLMGKIDRVDICDDGSKIYIKIIDYKTGSKQFDFDKMYLGLQMQLPLYMEAAREFYGKKLKKEAVPAGFLYYRIDDPLIKESDVKSGNIEAGILQALKPSGLVADDRTSLTHLDNTFTEGVRSGVIPAGLSKESKFYKGSKVISQEKFDEIAGFIDRKIREISMDILDGKVPTEPYQFDKDNTSCTYCPFGDICRFDTSLEYCSYKRIEKTSDDDFSTMIKE